MEKELNLKTVAKKLNELINDSLRDETSLVIRCQSLIEQYGFSPFKDAFDVFLIDKKTLQKIKRDQSFSKILFTINKILMDIMGDTFIVVMLEGAKIQAKGILSTLGKPDVFFMEQARALAEKDNYREAKEVMKKSATEVAMEKINATETTDETEAIKKERVSGIQTELSHLKIAIDQMKTTPLDYYCDKARLVKLKKDREFFLPDSGQNLDGIDAFIKNDILSKSAIKLRTLTMERYILIAEQLIDSGNAAAALPVFTAFCSPEIHRLTATKKGLSTHAKAQLEQLEHLFNPTLNATVFIKYVEQMPDAYICPNLIAGMLEFVNSTLIHVDEHGHRTLPLLKTPVIYRMDINSRTIENKTSLEEVNQQLLAEIFPERYSYSALTHEEMASLIRVQTQKKEVIDNVFYDISLGLEPRNHAPSFSLIMRKIEQIIRPMTEKELSRTRWERILVDIEQLTHFMGKIPLKMGRIKGHVASFFEHMHHGISFASQRVQQRLRHSHTNSFNSREVNESEPLGDKRTLLVAESRLSTDAPLSYSPTLFKKTVTSSASSSEANALSTVALSLTS